MGTIKAVFALLKDTVAAFLQDKATLYAAGLAYYTVFSLAPLLVFVITVAGAFIGRSAAGEQIVTQLEFIVGADLGGFVEELITTLNEQEAAGTITALSLVGLFFAASGIFNQLRNSLNIIWGIVAQRPSGSREWLLMVRSRAIPFLMVFVLGFLLSISVLFDTVLGIAEARLGGFFPEAARLLPAIGNVVVPALTFVTFTLVYKVLPDAWTRWRDVALGGLLATVLFLAGRSVLAYFLVLTNTGSVYGTAGSLIVLLVWVYFSANLLLLGAEFIWLYALRHGRPIRPNAVARFEGDLLVDEQTATPSGLRPDERIL